LQIVILLRFGRRLYSDLIGISIPI
jgi:hypothetical protein